MTQDINLEYLTLLNLEMKQKEEEKESIIFSFYLFFCLSLLSVYISGELKRIDPSSADSDLH